MANIVFINYRRADTANAAGRLYDRLEAHYGADKLFMDVDKIAGGVDFVTELDKRLVETDVLLVLIGASWLTVQDESTGERRLDNPDDYVRVEIEKALGRDIEIIPVLVDGATMPSPDDLPELVKPLSRRNAMRLTHERFRADAQGLISSIDQALERISARRQAENEQKRIEEERRKADEQQRREQEQARLLEQKRLDAIAGLSPEQISAAEAVANWDFIKDSNDPEDFRNHLARYPDHEASFAWARSRLDETIWQSLDGSESASKLQAYLNEMPKGKYVAEANARLTALKETDNARKADEERRDKEYAAWEAVKGTTDPGTLQAFLSEYPRGVHATEARRLYRAMSGKSVLSNRPVQWMLAIFFLGMTAALSWNVIIPESTRGYWTAQSRISDLASYGGQTLDLSYLNLDEVPAELFDQTSLSSLDLSGNNIQDLPPEIGELVNLTSLDVSNNSLRTLPPTLTNLTKITSLDLSANSFDEFPDAILSLSQLEDVDLSSNYSISALPSDLDRLTALKKLDLGYGGLAELPSQIGALRSLEYLDLKYNSLTTLPPEMGQLNQLTHLDLANNPLQPPFDALWNEGATALMNHLRGRPAAPAVPDTESDVEFKGTTADGKELSPEAAAELFGTIFGRSKEQTDKMQTDQSQDIPPDTTDEPKAAIKGFTTDGKEMSPEQTEQFMRLLQGLMQGQTQNLPADQDQKR